MFFDCVRLRRGRTHRYSIVPLQRGLTQGLRQPLALLWSSVALVLLVACVNLAGLTVARGARRMREIATRLALGSGRAAILRQLMIESCVVAAVGVTAGLLLSILAVDALRTLAQHALDVWQPVRIDARAIAAALGFGTVAVVVFGIAPAFHATRLDVQRGLASGGGRTVAGSGSHWGRRLLVVSQVALAMVLMVGAGLLVRTFTHLRGLNPGFDASGVSVATASLQDARYGTNVQVSELARRTLEHITRDPQVEAAAVSLGLPY